MCLKNIFLQVSSLELEVGALLQEIVVDSNSNAE